MLSVQTLVDAQIYPSTEAVIADALRHLLQARPELKFKLAIYRYKKENISLAKAASIAGVSWAQMKDILLEKGISLRLGVETLIEAKNDIQALRQELEAT
jgi:predicted HTH domain antitoxin